MVISEEKLAEFATFIYEIKTATPERVPLKEARLELTSTVFENYIDNTDDVYGICLHLLRYLRAWEQREPFALAWGVYRDRQHMSEFLLRQFALWLKYAEAGQKATRSPSVAWQCEVVRCCLGLERMTDDLWTVLQRLGVKSAQAATALGSPSRGNSLNRRALVTCIAAFGCQQRFDVAPLLDDALLHVELSAKLVEAFAAGCSTEQRRHLRHELTTAAARNPAEWQRMLGRTPSACPRVGRPRTGVSVSNDVKRLLRSLQGDSAAATAVIYPSWAKRVLLETLRQYKEESLPYDHFHEICLCVLGQRPQFRHVLVGKLAGQFGDEEEATKWANRPIARMEQSPIAMLPMSLAWQPRPDCLALPPSVAITFVESAEAFARFYKCVANLKSAGSVVCVGVDAEWSPYRSFNSVSILQVALPNEVFIFDVQFARVDDSTFRLFFRFLFSDPKILKIGFGFHEDLLNLRHAKPSCASLLIRPNGVVNMQTLIKQVEALIDPEKAAREEAETQARRAAKRQRRTARCERAAAAAAEEDGDESDAAAVSAPPANESDEAPAENEAPPARTNLSSACEQWLGAALDKSNQCSVWDRRPLRPAQLHYAALDAHCLLQIYGRVEALARERAVDFSAAVANSLYSNTAPLPLFCDADA